MSQRRLMGEWSPTAWVTTQTAFTQAFGFLLFAVQAPILGPGPFGLLSIVMVFVGFVESVLAECASEILISLPNAEVSHYAVMNTLCAMASVLCGAGIYFLARPIAAWFAAPELIAVCHWMSILPALAIAAAPANAATKRDMLFKPLAPRTMVSLAAGGVVGVTLTVLHCGVWALVWQTIVQKAVAAVVLWHAVPLRIRFRGSWRHVVALGPYAGPLFVSRSMSWASGSVPRFVLGTFLGVVDLGIMNLASRLSDIAIQIFIVPRYSVARVALRRYRVDRAGLEGAVQRLVFEYSLLTFPACLGAAAIMPSLFRAWLDPRWYAGVAPSQLLLLTCIPLVTVYTTGAVLMALNEQRAEAWLETAQTLGALLAAVFGAPLGLVTSAAFMTLRPFVLLPAPLFATTRQCRLSAIHILKPQGPLLAAALLMAVVVTLLQRTWELRNSLASAALAIAAGTVVYAGIVGVMFPQLATRWLGYAKSKLR